MAHTSPYRFGTGGKFSAFTSRSIVVADSTPGIELVMTSYSGFFVICIKLLLMLALSGIYSGIAPVDSS